ncbi:MAG TPA: hypothetical protein VFI95_05185 [Terriglobales bacterium]|nr:hypothetical protein [Terriglobales bacterium]
MHSAIGSTSGPLYGSVLLRFSGHHPLNIFTASIVHHEGYPINFHFDAVVVTPGVERQSHETVWWLPHNTSDGFLIVSSLTARGARVRVQMSDNLGHVFSSVVQLHGFETRRESIRDLVLSGRLSGSYGGVRVLPDKNSGQIKAELVLFDESAGFSAIMKSFGRAGDDQPEEHSVRGPLMALSNPDPRLGLPAGTTLRPFLFLRNTSRHAITPKIDVNWQAESMAGVAQLSTSTIPPGAVRQFDLLNLQSSHQVPKDAHWATVSVSYQGSENDLIVLAASYDPTFRYGLQTPFFSSLSYAWKGGRWEVGPDHDTFLTVGNGANKPAQAAVTFFYNGASNRYEVPTRTLKPGEQFFIDMAEIVHNQIPDMNGKTIPPDITSGSYEVLEPGAFAGHLYENKIHIDRAYGTAVYGCAFCCGAQAVELAPDPFGLLTGGSGDMSFMSEDSCTATWGNATSLSFGWNTSNSAIATASSPLVHGVAAGSTQANATANLTKPSLKFAGTPACQSQDFPTSGPVNVRQVSQSPLAISMSTGDTNQNISVTESGPAGNLAFSVGLTSNPNSGCASTVTIPGNSNFSGSAGFKVSASSTTCTNGFGSPSGIFGATACVTGACSAQGTTISIPPQVLIQVLYGEAHGQAAAGDSISEPAIGSSIKDRFGRSEFPGGSTSTYQAVVIASQYAGINTSITTGVNPELSVAINLFNGTQSDTVAGSPCFFSPTAADWSALQAALKSGTATMPSLSSNDPRCYAQSSPSRQIVYKSSIGKNVNGNGAPAFVFERQKSSNTVPAVVQIQ